MPRWAPLTRYLEGAEQDRLDLSLSEIEDILGAPLPVSARRHRTIVWSNSSSNPYARIWRTAGYRSTLRGLSTEQVAFVRDGAPAEALTRPEHLPSASTIVLVGCVKTKADARLPARELYRSPLFLRRRAYAEHSGKPWFVLSALHGLVAPDDPIDPYDLYLADQPEAYCHRWGERVVEQLEERFDSLAAQVFELHASAAYVHPVAPPLQRAGGEVIWPFEGFTFGEHLRWYRSRLPQAAVTEVRPAPPDDANEEECRGAAARTGLARRITEAFSAGGFDLGARPDPPTVGWPAMPDVRAAAALRSAGADDVIVRTVCTFLSAIERGRDPDRLWQRGVELYRAAPWVYRPAQVIETSQATLSDTLREAGVSRRHLADAAAWRLISEGLLDPAVSGEIHRAVYAGYGDALAVLAAVERLSDAGTPLFPLLRDPGTAPNWVRILAYPGGARITGMDKLPMTVDARVRKVSEYLDVSRTDHRPIDQVWEVLQGLWRTDVEDHGALGPGPLADTTAAVEPALWFLGTWGCSWCERTGHREPVGDICASCRFDVVRGKPDHSGAASGRDDGRTTARQEILAAVRDLTVRGEVPFSPAEVIAEMQRRGTSYPAATLRTHIVSTMCANAPGRKGSRKPDLVRVARGQYRLYVAE